VLRDEYYMRTSRVKEGRQEEFERSRRRQDPHLRNGCQRLVVKCVKCTGENLRRNLKKKAWTKSRSWAHNLCCDEFEEERMEVVCCSDTALRHEAERWFTVPCSWSYPYFEIRTLFILPTHPPARLRDCLPRTGQPWVVFLYRNGSSKEAPLWFLIGFSEVYVESLYI
jgi:hypothetical protein